MSPINDAILRASMLLRGESFTAIRGRADS